MGKFPETLRFELGNYVDTFVRWLQENFDWLFDIIKNGILKFLLAIEAFLLFLPWWLVIIVIFLLGWKIRSWKSGLLYAELIFLIGTFGLWAEMMTTLGLVITGVIISLIIGIPVGILTAYSDRLEMILKPVLD